MEKYAMFKMSSGEVRIVRIGLLGNCRCVKEC